MTRLALNCLWLSSMEKSSDLENNPVSHSSSDPYGHTDKPNLEAHTNEFPNLCGPSLMNIGVRKTRIYFYLLKQLDFYSF